jgi:hypothetical protein
MESFITSWFNTPRMKDYSPIQTIGIISRSFLKNLQELGYNIVDFKLFQRRLCTAICALREKRMTGKPLFLNMLSLNNFDLPEEWTREKEHAWFDYHRVNVFDTNFWIDFWENNPSSMSWEKDIGNWRLEIQDIMIQSIDRDNNILLNKCGFKRNDEINNQEIIQVDSDSYMSD